MRLVLMDDSKDFDKSHVIDYIEDIRVNAKTRDGVMDMMDTIKSVIDMIQYHDGHVNLDHDLVASLKHLRVSQTQRKVKVERS